MNKDRARQSLQVIMAETGVGRSLFVEYVEAFRKFDSAKQAVQQEMNDEGAKGHLMTNGQTKAWPAYEQAAKEYDTISRQFHDALKGR